MKKTSLYIDPEVDRKLALCAAEAGVSKAEYIRRVLADGARPKRRPKPRGRASFRGPVELAQNLDSYLAEDGFGER